MRTRWMRVGEVFNFARRQRTGEYAEGVNFAVERGIGGELAFADVIGAREQLPRTNRKTGVCGNWISVQVKQTFCAIERDGDVAPGVRRQRGGRVNGLLRAAVFDGETHPAGVCARREKKIFGCVAAEIEDPLPVGAAVPFDPDRKSTRLNYSHLVISY